MAVHTFETRGDELTSVQALPELLVFGTVVFLRFTEHTVMLAFDLRQAVTHGAEEAVIGGEHMPFQVELDQRGRTHQRSDEVFMFTRALDGAGKVAGEHRKLLDAPLRTAHRLHD